MNGGERKTKTETLVLSNMSEENNVLDTTATPLKRASMSSTKSMNLGLNMNGKPFL